jgi:hypothetical protein
MRLNILAVSLALALLSAGCSMLSPDTKSGGASENFISPPFPRTKSIMPLSIGNRWMFSYTAYDSLGKMIIPNRLDLHLSISGGYGLTGGSTLDPVDTWTSRKKYDTYIYRYEWEEQDSGILVTYRDLYPLERRGLYAVGEYKGGNARLFPTEQLWLAYPADSGKTWQYSTDGSGDSSTMSSMELISTRGRYYFPNNKSMTALSFCDCYVYKETMDNSTYYYYFNETLGLVGCQHFIDDKLRVTFLLKSYSLQNMDVQYY